MTRRVVALSAVAALLAAGISAAGAAPAHADWRQSWVDAAFAEVDPAELSTLEGSVVDLSADVADLSAQVTDMVSRSADAGQSVVTLSSDVLFEFGKAEVSVGGKQRIPQEVARLPKGAQLSVYGHTDSVGDDAANMKLSTARAQAVAAVIKAARPDLVLDVKGLGETAPVAPNEVGGKDSPGNRAKNRRVELRHD